MNIEKTEVLLALRRNQVLVDLDYFGIVLTHVVATREDSAVGALLPLPGPFDHDDRQMIEPVYSRPFAIGGFDLLALTDWPTTSRERRSELRLLTPCALIRPCVAASVAGSGISTGRGAGRARKGKRSF